MNNIIEFNNESNILTRNPTRGVELELVNRFIDFKKNIFEKKCKNDELSMAIFEELKVESSYPDIIFVEYKKENFDKWNENRKKLNNQDLKILYHIYMKKGISNIQLKKQLGINDSTVLEAITKLLDAKMIERKNKQWQICDRKNFFAITKIETVEAKINQWNSALIQAINNLRFSSESYVLSNTKQEPNSTTKNKFDNLGIGMYQEKNDKFNMIMKAKKNRIPNSYSSLVLEEIIGKRICV